MPKIIIALDGYSGTGKSSTAKAVAKVLGYTYIDSGAMYRATTLYFLNADIDLSNSHAISNSLENISIRFEGEKVLLNEKDVTNQIRSMRVNQEVSRVSAIPEVRKEMVKQQQEMGKSKGIVMDGRDIGTVVFPHADLKIFMTADPGTRARRRQKELEEKGIIEELKVIKDNLLDRDRKDTSRSESPLRKAERAIEIDTTTLSFEEQVQKVVSEAKKFIDEN